MLDMIRCKMRVPEHLMTEHGQKCKLYTGKVVRHDGTGFKLIETTLREMWIPDLKAWFV